MLATLAAALCGAPDALSALGAEDVARVVDAAERHGVLPLLAERLAGDARCPEALGLELQRRARRHAAADLVREPELRRLGHALHDAKVPALVVKGAHLAYGLYPRPDLRPRLDTDVLLPASARADAAATLERLGYAPVPVGGGDLISYQATFTRARGEGLVHVVDLHWRLANPQAFGDVLAFEDLETRAAPIHGVAPWRGPALADALLIAAVHRIAHHPGDDRLIWLYDLDLIARRLNPAAWTRVVELAAASELGMILSESLDRARHVLGTPVPDAVLAGPRLEPGGARAVARAAFLAPHRPRARLVAQDFSMLPSWSARLKWAGQYLFPSPQYMRTVYAPASPWPLPLLYARRVVRGAWRLIVRS